MRAPFPWFGGKFAVAAQIWDRLGDVPNYVEPFFGSGAVLLARTRWQGRIETVNDADGMLSNFWRSVKYDPAGVADAADWPLNERDLAARHYWLVTQGVERLKAIDGDPSAFDAEVAGWWLWGLCAWIGGGWCSGKGSWVWGDDRWIKNDAGQGISRRLPHLGPGRGINRKLPHATSRAEYIRGLMQHLSERLRDVRVCHGDWSRVMGPWPRSVHGITGIFLDPPYADTAGRTKDIYAVDCLRVAHDVRGWAIANGDNPLLRICLAGYEGEHEMPNSWDCVPWKAHGGYGNRGGEDGMGRVNCERERLWFSPHCVGAKAPSLMDWMETT